MDIPWDNPMVKISVVLLVAAIGAVLLVVLLGVLGTFSKPKRQVRPPGLGRALESVTRSFNGFADVLAAAAERAEDLSAQLAAAEGQGAGLRFRSAELKHDAAMACPVCAGRGVLAEGWCASSRWRWCEECQHLYGPGKWMSR